MVKTELHYFVRFKLKIMEIFVHEYFHIFLTLHIYYTAHDKKFNSAKKQHKDSKYVESFGVSTTDFKLKVY